MPGSVAPPFGRVELLHYVINDAKATFDIIANKLKLPISCPYNDYTWYGISCGLVFLGNSVLEIVTPCQPTEEEQKKINEGPICAGFYFTPHTTTKAAAESMDLLGIRHDKPFEICNPEYKKLMSGAPVIRFPETPVGQEDRGTVWEMVVPLIPGMDQSFGNTVCRHLGPNVGVLEYSHDVPFNYGFLEKDLKANKGGLLGVITAKQSEIVASPKDFEGQVESWTKLLGASYEVKREDGGVTFYPPASLTVGPSFPPTCSVHISKGPVTSCKEIFVQVHSIDNAVKAIETEFHVKLPVETNARLGKVVNIAPIINGIQISICE